MRIALLIGANPKTCNSGAFVRLLKGKWTLVFEGLKDSIFSLNFEGRHFLVPHTREFIVDAPEHVFLNIEHKGCEESISIFAHKIED